MNDDLTIAIEVPMVGDERHKNWAKVVTNVDPSLSSGWAFEGDFIATGGIQDVPIGSVILVYGERGSRTNPQSEAQVLRANADGTVTQLHVAKGRAWARTLRDAVADALDEHLDTPLPERPWDAALMAYSSDALETELARRNSASEDPNRK
ncbi:MAG: hypothetical protein QNJ71_04685 [Acidimicrobiia bacterium]|nr:hypothetical protein [Acidimicrobiia bacterium]